MCLQTRRQQEASEASMPPAAPLTVPRGGGLQGDTSTCPAPPSPAPQQLGAQLRHPDTVLAPPDGRVGPWAEDGLHDPPRESSPVCQARVSSCPSAAPTQKHVSLQSL